MDAGRDRPRAVGRGHRLAGGPGAGRRPGRCRRARSDSWPASRSRSSPPARLSTRHGRSSRPCWRRRSLQAAASCVLGPAIAAISLGLVGYAAIGERFGRNARFASIGAGLSAAVMGACGYFFSAQAVFFVTAALLIPALLVLRRHDPRRRSIRSGLTAACPSGRSTRSRSDLRSLLRQTAAAGLRRLHPAVPSRQRRHAAARWAACSPCA